MKTRFWTTLTLCIVFASLWLATGAFAIAKEQSFHWQVLILPIVPFLSVLNMRVLCAWAKVFAVISLLFPLVAVTGSLCKPQSRVLLVFALGSLLLYWFWIFTVVGSWYLE